MSSSPGYGIELIENLGIGILVIAILFLRFSSLPRQWLAKLAERSVENCPPDPDFNPEDEQRILKRVKRRMRGHTRMLLRFQRRRMKRERVRKMRIAFDWVAGILVAYVLLDWLVIPEPYRLADERRLPIALAVFATGTLIIFMGSQSWDGRIGWKKWTFWISVLSCFLAVLCATTVIPISRPRSAFGLMVLAAIFFLWLFGTLRRIDRQSPHSGGSSS